MVSKHESIIGVGILATLAYLLFRNQGSSTVSARDPLEEVVNRNLKLQAESLSSKIEARDNLLNRIDRIPVIIEAKFEGIKRAGQFRKLGGRVGAAHERNQQILRQEIEQLRRERSSLLQQLNSTDSV